MDIEQIKLITDMVRNLGESGKEGFIWWVILDKGLPFILGLAALLVGANLLSKLLRLALGKDEGLIIEFRDALRTGTHGPLVEHERQATAVKIRELIAEYKAKKGA